jgi:two-component system cell cycle sensor histidine kinase/response regulator CckA
MVRADFDQFDGKEVARLLALVEAQRRYYQEMVDGLPAPVAVLAADRTVVWANRAFRQTFGVPAAELRGKTLEQVLKPMPAITQVPLRRWDDDDETETLVVVGGATEPAEQQSLAAARADALYTFAGRVAHDLNNPLMIVTGYAEELLESLPPNDPLRKNVSEIVAAAGRISVLGGQLVDIARKHARPPSQVNIAEVVAAAKIKGARVSPAPSPVLALADTEQLAEVLQAIASGRTKVAISWNSEGHFARITVQGEGPAIDATIFDPILTKTVDPSAGMTLARAYAIVREWGGDIAVTGSAFTIRLPSTASSERAPEGDRETILVVEDEAGIRGLIVRILRREGYQVTDVASAEEALAAARKTSARLLITDVKLPGMSGPDLARRLHTATPALKVLYISGYTDDPAARTGSYPPGAGFLAKPFTLTALVAKVRETLAS